MNNDDNVSVDKLRTIIEKIGKKRGINKNRACGVAGIKIAKIMKRSTPYGHKTVMQWVNGNHTIKPEVAIAISKAYAKMTTPPLPRHRITVNCKTAENKAILVAMGSDAILDAALERTFSIEARAFIQSLK